MAFSAAGLAKTFFRPKKSVAFGTAFQTFIPPGSPKLRAKVLYWKYTVGAATHTVTFMRTMATTKVKTAAIAGATSLVIARDPGNYSANATADGKAYTPSVANNLVAANDWLAVLKPDGTWLVFQPSAASTGTDGSVTLTVSALPTGGIAANAPVHFFGAAGDTDPKTNEAHPSYGPTASATTAYDAQGGSLVETVYPGDAMLFNSDNPTATGTLEYIAGIYGP